MMGKLKVMNKKLTSSSSCLQSIWLRMSFSPIKFDGVLINVCVVDFAFGGIFCLMLLRKVWNLFVCIGPGNGKRD